MYKLAVFIAQADRQTVKFGFDCVFNCVQPATLTATPVKRLDFCRFKRVIERQHRQPVGDLGERRHRCGTDALGGGIRADECRILGFQVLQFAQQPVVFGVRDFRRIERVIQVIMMLDFRVQLLRALVCRVH